MSMKKEEVYQEMKEEDVVVLNVLSPQDFGKVHIRGSFNVQLGDDHQAFVRAVEDHFGRDKFFITYSSDRKSAKAWEAAKILNTDGFKAEDFEGGLQEWMESGYPVDGSKAEELAILD
jgi:rhodanese-related sulfurtransferase